MSALFSNSLSVRCLALVLLFCSLFQVFASPETPNSSSSSSPKSSAPSPSTSSLSRDTVAKGSAVAAKGSVLATKGSDTVAKGSDTVAKGIDAVAKGSVLAAKSLNKAAAPVPPKKPVFQGMKPNDPMKMIGSPLPLNADPKVATAEKQALQLLRFKQRSSLLEKFNMLIKDEAYKNLTDFKFNGNLTAQRIFKTELKEKNLTAEETLHLVTSLTADNPYSRQFKPSQSSSAGNGMPTRPDLVMSKLQQAPLGIKKMRSQASVVDSRGSKKNFEVQLTEKRERLTRKVAPNAFPKISNVAKKGLKKAMKSADSIQLQKKQSRGSVAASSDSSSDSSS